MTGRCPVGDNEGREQADGMVEAYVLDRDARVVDQASSPKVLSSLPIEWIQGPGFQRKRSADRQ